MLNLYKTMSRQQQADREDMFTGHDRFSQCHHDRIPRRRRHRTFNMSARRAQSAAEFNPRTLAKARASLQRSASTEVAPGPSSESGERTPLLANSLAKLFSCVSVSSVKNVSPEIRPGAAPRHSGRYEYTALEADSTAHERLELERKAREQAQSACLHYLRCCPRYSLLQHLNDIGSRVDKHWFIVRDSSVKTERLLTLVPKSVNCPIQCDTDTRNSILDLFLALQHPYIYPVLDLEFRDSASGSQTFVVLVLPFNNKGSLKDLIHKSGWQDEWCDKYGQRSEGLPITQVQRLGRQILEALLFLKERGFPPFSHLHSGNIILQNGVARLSGLENTLFGFTSRIHGVIWSNARNDPNAVDVVCFGHVMFEMCAGYELTTPQPSASNLLDIDTYPQVVEVLEFIFHHPKHRFPSIEELLLCDFFRNIDLREMRATSLPQVYHARLTSSTLSLLNEVKRHQNNRRSRRTQSTSTPDPPSPSRRRERVPSSSEGESVEDDAETPDSPYESDNDTGGESGQEHRNLSLHTQQSLIDLTMESQRLVR